MWEIKCIVGDKKALEVLEFLTGRTLEPPVINHIGPIVANGHGKPTNPAAGSIEMLRKFVPGKKSVTARQLREHLEANGYSKNGYSYALKKLLDDGILKKTKEPRVYEVAR